MNHLIFVVILSYLPNCNHSGWSKRETFKHKYKVQRKVKEHNRKLKRLAKQNPLLMQRRGRKLDPGIPNLFPFKEALLDDAEQERRQREQIAEDLKRAKREAKEAKVLEKQRLEAEQANEYKQLNTPEGKRKWYFKELKKVVESADIIIQVLDARDPMGCRAKDVEQFILKQQNKDGSPSKRLILVLNKIDMVPPEVTAAWVQYLRREYPCLAFKSNTTKGRGHLAALDVKTHKATSKALDSKSTVGAGPLLQLLKNYARTQGTHKKTITVGVIGYPNVGKSSIINSLKMSRAVQVSAAPGCTKVVQSVKLDGTITLLDSPGVLFAADEEEGQKALLLRNVLRVEQIEDPVEAVQGIIERCSQEQMMTQYQVPEYSNVHEFLLFVAQRRGKLGTGGVPNIVDAARVVLGDWNSGKIPFYTLPPEVTDIESSSVVNEWGKLFDIDSLLDQANESTLQMVGGMEVDETRHDDEGDDDDEEMGDDDGDEDDEMDDGYTDEYKGSQLSSRKTGVQAIGSYGVPSAGVIVEDSSEDEEEEEEMGDMGDMGARATKKELTARSTISVAAAKKATTPAAGTSAGVLISKKKMEAQKRMSEEGVGENVAKALATLEALMPGVSESDAIAVGKRGKGGKGTIELAGTEYGTQTTGMLEKARKALKKKEAKQARRQKTRGMGEDESMGMGTTGNGNKDDNSDYDFEKDWQ